MFRQWKNFFRTQGRDSRFVPEVFRVGTKRTGISHPECVAGTVPATDAGPFVWTAIAAALGGPTAQESHAGLSQHPPSFPRSYGLPCAEICIRLRDSGPLPPIPPVCTRDMPVACHLA
jgi:hypothetical protein